MDKYVDSRIATSSLFTLTSTTSIEGCSFGNKIQDIFLSNFE